MKELYITNKITSLLNKRSYMQHAQSAERKKIRDMIVNRINFEIQRETEEMKNRLCAFVDHLIEKEIAQDKIDELNSIY